MDNHLDKLQGCLLGCAVGDAIGLPFEGMSPGRVTRMLKPPLGHQFLFGKGMVSDDTDHTVLVAQSLCRHPDDVPAFVRCLAWKFRWWLACFPAGVGLATLRSLLKLWVGFSPGKSGVFSAGNGPAMRSAIIGIRHWQDADRRRDMVRACTRLTHVDPKAEFGAQAVAEMAALVVPCEGSFPSWETIQDRLQAVSEDDHWRECVARVALARESGRLLDALPSGVRDRGVTGYVYHTVPVAIAAWLNYQGDFRATIESVVKLGGDTDTVAAIAGALAGVSVGCSGIPGDWVDGIMDRPHGPAYLRSLGQALAEGRTEAVRMSPLLFPRGVVFTLLVLGHGFRRLLPPYGTRR